MNPENTQKLYAAFPRLYRGRSKPPEVSSMAMGFDCNDGWFDLIWNLSQAIEDVARRDGHDPQSEDWPEAAQVKQKVGALRFHLAKNTNTFAALVDNAMKASEEICEVCGAPGAMSADIQSGVRTVCNEHNRECLRGSSTVEPRNI